MRSIRTGFDEMSSLVTDFGFEIFGVTETWLDPSIPSDHFEIPGYTLYKADRQATAQHTHRTGGGVAVYVREDISLQLYELVNVEPGIEFISMVLKIGGVRLGVAIVYRPPHVSCTCLDSLFRALFVDMAVEVDSVICLGNMNVDLLSSSSYETKHLRRLLKSSNTTQVITEPTRVTATTATLIDHIIVETSAELERSGVIDASRIKDYRDKNITDHKLIFVEVKSKVEKRQAKLITYRDFSNFSVENALCMIKEINWDGVRNIEGVDNINNFLTSSIKRVYDSLAPLVTKRVKKRKTPWRTDDISVMIKRKNKLRRKYWKYGNDNDWTEYKSIRNKLNNLIWKAKRKYFKDKLDNCKSTTDFWKCLRQKDIVGPL